MTTERLIQMVIAYSLCIGISSFQSISRSFLSRSNNQHPNLLSAAMEPPGDNTDWIKNAMGNTDDPEEEEKKENIMLQPGISGFAVDPSRGFVVVISGDEVGSSEQKKQRATYAVITTEDTERVSSAEALCLVQLAGRIDVGAAVFPPDSLAKLAAEEFDGTIDEWRPRISLVGVEAVSTTAPSSSSNENDKQSSESDADNSDGTGNAAMKASSPDRDEKIISGAPKLVEAVTKLPGLGKVTLDSVIDAMRLHADDGGNFDRGSFSELLDTLRKGLVMVDDSKVNFVLTVFDKESASLKKMPAPTFQAIALALRYQVSVVVTDDCLSSSGFDAADIRDEFPAFRPIRELFEDAKLMDGFIPSMFFKEKGPENDDKV
mmetsp:Transcript_42151/g.61815  ORF Transcript_42151/g.61815 Transcript_42151/m.61815 type:complete len:376 (-) Transcript_42151:128-1255(-)|eukprot:CAMPEP_0195525340 /NCGR_PEP_ID=MMETSP0794_2-20130614/25757_1 /TAXON_ID=515487 /ORGANISM="Stephanopyxis turris, Strain CCMP 815" /LENGTH=375 /DNA_ID=CAMNT_0040655787 /DNA_START=96 /DNA_END=1223 /DNA_ORIENTATION=-